MAASPSSEVCGMRRPVSGSGEVDSGDSVTAPVEATIAISAPLANVENSIELSSIPTCEGYVGAYEQQ